MARAALVALALIGCHHVTPTLYGEAVPAGCSADGPTGDEACMGWYIDRTKMVREEEYDDPALVRYVSAVGARIVAVTGDHRTWRFRVLDDPNPQAEANISTTIYLTRGALARLRDEAELAGLLGHEIGHVVAGHARDAIVDMGRGLDSTRDLRAQRDDEIQADELAVLFAHRAGYDPRAVETMLRALAAGEDETDAAHADDSHPKWTERVARIQAFAGKLPRGGQRRAADYVAHLGRLVVGVDPRRAAIVDGAAVFAHANIAAAFPRDWMVAISIAGAVSVQFADDRNVVMYVLPRAAASTVTPVRKLDAVTETVPVGDKLLVIKTTGPHDVIRTADEARAAVRVPTAAERERLAPARIDLATPRVLWPDPVPKTDDKAPPFTYAINAPAK